MLLNLVSYYHLLFELEIIFYQSLTPCVLQSCYFYVGKCFVRYVNSAGSQSYNTNYYFNLNKFRNYFDIRHESVVETDTVFF